MRKKTKNRHGGFGLQVLMLLFLLLVGANGAYAQSDCFEYEENVIIGRKIPVGTGVAPLADFEQPDSKIPTEADLENL